MQMSGSGQILLQVSSRPVTWVTVRNRGPLSVLQQPEPVLFRGCISEELGGVEMDCGSHAHVSMFVHIGLPPLTRRTFVCFFPRKRCPGCLCHPEPPPIQAPLPFPLLYVCAFFSRSLGLVPLEQERLWGLFRGGGRGGGPVVQ